MAEYSNLYMILHEKYSFETNFYPNENEPYKVLKSFKEKTEQEENIDKPWMSEII